jgi:tetratricopeptide (TPR) repeat protein
VAAVVAVGFAVALALQAGRKGGGTSPDGRVVVAVADVVNETGERELDVLSGLLVTSLEQSRRLSVMTQARVLDLAIRAGRKDAARVDETIGREVGAAHGVRALLLPAIRRLGSIYSLEMRAIDPGRDRHLFTLSDRATSKDALLDVLDRLSDGARKRLGEGAADVAEASVQLGEAMTRSVEAYQHYSTGLEAWLRDGQRAVGLREFLEAIRIDPRFAAAHFQVWGVYLVYGRPDLAAPHLRVASEHLDRMPEKEQALFRMDRAVSFDAFEHRDPAEAVRLANALEARFPDDKYVLAVASDVYAAEDIDRRADAERVLRRALALDPGYFIGADSIQGLLGDRPAERLEIARRAVATRRSAANLATLAQVELDAGSREAADGAAREALRLDGGQNSLVLDVACFVLDRLAGRPACVAEWRRLLEAGPNEHERDLARQKLVASLAVEGRRREALRLLRSVPEERQGRPWELSCTLSIGLPRAAAFESRAVARRNHWPLVRRYQLAAFGAFEEAEAMSAALPRIEVAEMLYAPLRLAAERRHAEAADAQRRAIDWCRAHGDGESRHWHAALLADLLLAAGRWEEAAAVEPILVPVERADLVDRAENGPRLALARARAMEKLGRTADAIRELDGVIAFWKHADPDLPLLVEAKALRARLAKE